MVNNYKGITLSLLFVHCWFMIFVEGCWKNEREALLSFEKDLVFFNGTSFHFSHGNNTDDEDCCKWSKYVSCNKDGHITRFYLNYHGFLGLFLEPIRDINSVLNPSLQQLRYLEDLMLSGIDFGGARIPDWIGSFMKLRYLDLSHCKFSGPLPVSLGNLAHLEWLNLDGNRLQGGIPASLGKLCFLQVIYLRSNCFSGDLKDLFQNLSSGCTRSSLSYLDLSSNQITGMIPDSIITFSSLGSLYLASNKLNGTISSNIGLMSNLGRIDLKGNYLSGVLNETHFINFKTLYFLDLSNNALTLNFSSTWSPKFRANLISLRSCNLGPHFPSWLRSQLGRGLISLDISATGISDMIPNWFFNSSGFNSSNWTYMRYLNLSYNQIQGHLPKELGPTFLKNNVVIDLSDNFLSGEISSSICEVQDSDLEMLDLSQNLLFGEVPNHCFTQYKRLRVLNLANNKFSGRIPDSIWYLSSLQMLNLRANCFSGELRPSPNCTNLEFLDLSHNRLSGSILTWIGQQLPALMFLNLRANQFIGSIPAEFCRLKNLRILSLAMNKLSGTLPSCLDKIRAMASKQNLTATLKQTFLLIDRELFLRRLFPIGYYIDNAVLVWQGKEQQYSNILGYLILIDISDNRLTGEIPTEIVHLSELVALNLSRNNLFGRIPGDFGKLKNIQVVDLSRNQLSGHIPSSISQLTFLSLLDLSYNNLSGKIPSSTQILGFDPLRFARNPALCGPPLKLHCQGDDDDDPDHLPNPTHVGEHEEDEFHDQYWFYVGSAVGFVTGFWIICGTLLLKHSWRHAYFRLVDEVADRAFVAFIKLKARLQQ